MAKERTGKIERWILLHTYLKTIAHELPIKWELPRLLENTSDETYWKHLFKSETLRNFFKLEFSKKIPPFESKNAWADYFKGCGYENEFRRKVDAKKSEDRWRRALVAYTRTRNHMVKKGLVKTKAGVGPNTEGIRLTAKGKKKAKKIYSEDY